MSDFNPDEYLAKKTAPAEASSSEFDPDKYLASKDKGFGPTADGSVRKLKDVNWGAAVLDTLTNGLFPQATDMTVAGNPLVTYSIPGGAVSPIVNGAKGIVSGAKGLVAGGRAAYQKVPEIVKDVAPIVAGEAYDKALGDNHGRSSGIGLAILRRVISKGKH